MRTEKPVGAKLDPVPISGGEPFVDSLGHKSAAYRGGRTSNEKETVLCS